MKKLLAMVLALVMTLSLAVSANAAFKDEKDISDEYAEAVAVLNGMGVFKGYEDETFKPENKITRAEVATIIYRIYTQDLAKNDKSGLYASYNKFSDMTGAGWAAGYIGYCANAEFVKGYPDGTFKPSGNVTGYEVLTMILRAIGYDKNNEFTGADWAVNVAKYAEQAGVLENVKGVSLSAPATRELVAELLFRAIAKAPMVTYTAAFGYQTVSFSGSKADSKLFKDNETLGHKNFDLTPNATNGTYGRPATEWTYNCGDKSTTVYDTPVATYTAKFSSCDLCKDLGKSKEAKVTVAYVDGKETTDLAKTYSATDTKNNQGAQGQLVEVYKNEGGKDYTMVAINTYLGEVTKVYDADKDKNNHGSDASVDVSLYNFSAKYEKNFETEGFEKFDVVLATVDYNKTSGKYEIASLEDATSKDLELTKLVGVSKKTNDVQDILKLDGEDATVANTASLIDVAEIVLGETYTFYYDTYGNVIGVAKYAPAANYVVIDEIWKVPNSGKFDVHATLVKASDATSIEDAIVSKILSSDGKSDYIDGVYMKEENNHGFFHDLMTYTLNSKDQYVLTDVGTRYDEASYTMGDRYITAEDNSKVYLNKDTVILFQSTDSPDGTYNTYTYKTLPSFDGIMDCVEAENGYAEVIYIYGSVRTDRYVFVPDVTSTKDVCTIEKVKGEDDVYELTLKVKELNDKGELVDSTVVIKNKFAGVDFQNVTASAFGATHAGLYSVYTWGDYSWLVPCELQSVEDLKVVKDATTSIIVDGELIAFDEDDSPLYTRWTGDYTNISFTDGSDVTVDGDGYATKVEAVKKASSDDMKLGDLVYVQYDKDGENVVAVYDMYYKVDVDFADGYKTIDKDAKIDAPDMYLGKAAEDFTVDVSKYVTPSTDDEAFADPTAKDAEGKDIAHNVARTFTFKATGTVSGDIVVTLASDKCETFKPLASSTFSGINNWVVTVGAVDSTTKVGAITVAPTEGSTTATTVKIGELRDLLVDQYKTACGNVGVVTIKDNNAPADYTATINETNAANLLVVVTVDDGAEQVEYQYTVTYTPATHA